MIQSLIEERVAELYEEFRIGELGFDLFHRAKKMGVEVTPYSAYIEMKNADLLWKYDQDAFSSNLRRILTSSECFNMFKKEHIDLILDYLTSNVTNDRSVKSILNDIVNIEKGMGQLDSLNHYGIEMMRKKITSKAK